MQRVTPAPTTELLELEPVRRVLFVLGRHVVALFALRALQNNIISRHKNSFVVRRSLFVAAALATNHELRSTIYLIPLLPKPSRHRPFGRLRG
jgi:hypothetical protein